MTYRNTNSPDTESEIPSLRGVEGYCRIPINECAEPLVCIDKGGAPGLVVRLHYEEVQIPGAMKRCFVRKTVKELLISASGLLPPGFQLMILDAWRPVEVQQVLFDREFQAVSARFPGVSLEEAVEKVKKFVSLPSTGAGCPSPHLTGGSVDVTLCDENSNPLYLGTAFDDFTEKAHTTFFEKHAGHSGDLCDQENVALRNRRLLFHVMVASGFTNYNKEWWHFDYGNQFWGHVSRKPFAIYGPVLTAIN